MLKHLKLKPQRFLGLLVVVGVAVIGVRYLVVSRAATPYASKRAVEGTLSGNAVGVNDSTANGDQSVIFGRTTDCQPSTLPSATVDSAEDTLFSEPQGGDWLGGDIAYSTVLPDGREAFEFGDTLIGTIDSSGEAAFTGLPHNSELVGNPSGPFTADYAGTASAPSTLITDSLSATANWGVGQTYVENGQQLVFVNEFLPATDGALSIKFTGNTGVAIMKLPSGGLPTFSSVVKLPVDTTTQWGNAVTADNSYHYIYGEFTTGMKVARVPLYETLTPSSWQYWNGTSWVSSESSAASVANFQFNGVAPSGYQAGYMAVSITNSVYSDSTIKISYACNPQGPWSTPEIIYTIPEVSEYKDEIAYEPTFHPELNSSKGVVVSYSIDNLGSLTDIAANVHEYQPRFIYIK